MKKPFRKILLALCWIAFASSAQALEYRALLPGLDYAMHELSQTTKVHLLRVDLERFTLKPVLASQWQQNALLAHQLQEKSGALAVINANFFDPKNHPLGLILQDGKLLQAPHETAWWASFVLKGKKARILKTLAPDSWSQGVQAGPRLVVNGQTPKLKTENSPKSAVGIDSKGRVLLIATEGFCEINVLATWLATAEAQGGAGLRDALNLDGGSSTQFFAKVGAWELSVPGFVPVPLGLGIFRATAQ